MAKPEDRAYVRLALVQAAMFFPQDEAKRCSYPGAFIGAGAGLALDKGLHKSMTETEALQFYELARPSATFDGLKETAFRAIRRNKTKGGGSSLSPLGAGSIAANALLIPLICNLKYAST